MKHTLPTLPYAYDALEPYIDAKTMEIHYSKHHQAYCDKMNAVLEKYPDISEKDPVELLKSLQTLGMPEGDKKTFTNNAGGYVNHTIYWESMSPKKELDKALIDEITNEFGSVDKFKELFEATAMGQFGSGWAWLVRNGRGELKIYSTSNQDSPYSLGDTPIFALDVWEHAYYLKYQNKRADYIKNWWNVLKVI